MNLKSLSASLLIFGLSASLYAAIAPKDSPENTAQSQIASPPVNPQSGIENLPTAAGAETTIAGWKIATSMSLAFLFFGWLGWKNCRRAVGTWVR